MEHSKYTADDVYNAIFHDDWNKVERMIEEQPRLLNEKYDGVTTLYRIALYAESEDFVLRILRFAERDEVDALNKRPSGQDTVFHRLAIRGYSESIRRALTISTTQVNWQTRTGGNTPLHWLLKFRHPFTNHRDAVVALLNAGADVNIKNTNGVSPVDEYINNSCKGYNKSSRKEQKEEILKLLQRKKIPIEISARGPEALNAFNEALKEGEIEVNQGRTFFVGLERVGKTSTANSFLRKEFNPNEEITDAIVTKKACTQDLHGEVNWNETTCDHPGATEIYDDALADSMTKLLLNDERKEKSNIIEKNEPKAQIKETTVVNMYDEPDVPGIQNTATPQPPAIPEKIASKVEERMKTVMATREASSGWQISGKPFIMNIWDFGGQPIYHVIQRIFMVSYAVVCVVFSLKDDLDAPAKVMDPTTGNLYEHRMTNLQFILYWIRSIFMNSRNSKLEAQHSPSVLVIGTHLNSIGENAEEKAEEKFDKIREAMEGKPYESMVFSEFFAIENSVEFSRSTAPNIMKQIYNLAMKMVKTIPLKWLLVQQEIQLLRRKHIYLPTKEVLDLLGRCGVKHDTQQVLLLYFHDLGEILYFPDEEALKNIIVLDLMQLVDMFKTIITVINPKLQEPHLRDAWRKLNSGILEERLLKHLWIKFKMSNETFEFFISLMQKFGLICKRKSTKGGQRIFYVISRLKPERKLSSEEDYGHRAVSIFHDFGGYLPDDLFQRGATKFIEAFQKEDNEPKLSYEHVELDIDELHFVVLEVANVKHRRMLQTTIVIRKILNADLGYSDPLTNVCKKVLNFIEAELKLFGQSGSRGVELHRYVPCICSPTISNAHMHMMRNFDNKILPCGSNGMEMRRYSRLFGGNGSQQGVLSSESSVVVKPEGYVDDIVIARVSENMDLSWRRFGIRLDLNWSTINRFYANEQQTNKVVKTMIEYWRENLSSDQHQLQILCAALRQHGLNTLAETLTEGSAGNVVPLSRSTGRKEYLSDRDLLFICDHMSCEGRTLGIRLGLEWTNITEISSNNRHVQDSMMQILVSWRNAQSSNQLSIIITALREQGLINLAEKVCKRHCYENSADVATKAKRVHVLSKQNFAKGILRDIDFLFIAERFYSDWKNFGIHLGIKSAVISRIQSDFSPPMLHACIEMLVRWRDGREANENHLVTMSEALRSFGRVDIKDDLQAYYQESIEGGTDRPSNL